MSYSPLLKFRFMQNVKSVEDCWLWNSTFYKSGYGRIYVRKEEGRKPNTSELAHVIAYNIFKGEVPDGYELDHLCRTPACVNPEHLEVVTHKENMWRSNAPSALFRLKTHCIHGHEFRAKQPEYLRKRGYRMCHECHNHRQQARDKRLKMAGAIS